MSIIVWNDEAEEELAALRQNAEIMDAEMLNLRRHAYVLVGDKPYSGDEVAALLARIKELQDNIIEADSQSTVDKKPRDIYAAELALVRIAALGAEAMLKVAELEEPCYCCRENGCQPGCRCVREKDLYPDEKPVLYDAE
ncbi:MAG: hypothetical protein WC714_28795 [Candidatus Obscuribacterales bacterium]|jgi:hypothetical protein